MCDESASNIVATNCNACHKPQLMSIAIGIFTSATPKTWISGKVETNTGALVEDLVVARRLNQSSCMRREASIDEHRLGCDESWHMDMA